MNNHPQLKSETTTTTTSETVVVNSASPTDPNEGKHVANGGANHVQVSEVTIETVKVEGTEVVQHGEIPVEKLNVTNGVSGTIQNGEITVERSNAEKSEDILVTVVASNNEDVTGMEDNIDKIALLSSEKAISEDFDAIEHILEETALDVNSIVVQHTETSNKDLQVVQS